LAVTAILMRALGGSVSVRKTSGSTELARDEFNDCIRPDNRGDCTLSVFQRTSETLEIRFNHSHERPANEGELVDADDERRTAIISEKARNFTPQMFP
jgi:hypothetical protein